MPEELRQEPHLLALPADWPQPVFALGEVVYPRLWNHETNAPYQSAPICGICLDWAGRQQWQYQVGRNGWWLEVADISREPWSPDVFHVWR